MPFEKKYKIAGAVAAFLTGFFLCWSGLLSIADQYVTDVFYQRPGNISPQIKIIAIDEQTLEKFGSFNTWTRQRYADLIEVLTASPDNAPAVIAIDVLFHSYMDTAGDQALVAACEQAGNVVLANSIFFRNAIRTDASGKTYLDRLAIESVSEPYPELEEAGLKTGFVNTLQDAKDGYIRKSMLRIQHEDRLYKSFTAAIAEAWREKTGAPLVWPALDENNAFGFLYTSKPGGYETLSMKDVIDGTIPPEAFKNTVVMVGTCAAGMMDAYNVPIAHGVQMYGVEIHANILQALLDGRYAVQADPLWYALAVAAFTCLLFLASVHLRALWPICVGGGCIILLELAAGAIGKSNGLLLPLLPLPVCVILIVAENLLRRYIAESRDRRQIVNAFQKYVAPQVVEQIVKDQKFQLNLGGEKRNIAVLFVDIRGFTPLSESLQPEQVVEILNEYLGAVTEAIFQNGGTLDKFIGDAAMAIFNAPQDLEQPALKAVRAAMDIVRHSKEIEAKFMERFGKTVSYGIGVNYGEAVVGNIGCHFRMDYTAIGDTVNTAARLEANAKAGQILISQAVLDQTGGRADVTPLGEIPLKGKSKGVAVFQLNHLMEEIQAGRTDNEN